MLPPWNIRLCNAQKSMHFLSFFFFRRSIRQRWRNAWILRYKLSQNREGQWKGKWGRSAVSILVSWLEYTQDYVLIHTPFQGRKENMLSRIARFLLLRLSNLARVGFCTGQAKWAGAAKMSSCFHLHAKTNIQLNLLSALAVCTRSPFHHHLLQTSIKPAFPSAYCYQTNNSSWALSQAFLCFFQSVDTQKRSALAHTSWVVLLGPFIPNHCRVNHSNERDIYSILIPLAP